MQFACAYRFEHANCTMLDLNVLFNYLNYKVI